MRRNLPAGASVGADVAAAARLLGDRARLAMVELLRTGERAWLFWHQVTTGWTALALLWATLVFTQRLEWKRWYATIAGPNTIEQPEAKDWVAKYKAKFNHDPLNYALTSYDAVLVIADALERLVKDGKELTRANVRDYALKSELKTLQGTIAFDDNGDIKDRIVSVFQLKDAKYVYVGAAPQS